MRASRYHIQRSIKKGGMAEVLAARVIGTNAGDAKEVALKRILPELGDDESFRTAFLDEARIASCLEHPNIVAVYDYGVLDDDAPFLTMELVDGADLAELMILAAEERDPVQVEVVLAIGAAVARGLAHAHTAVDRAGANLEIVHRDVSPQNILISWQGEVKLTDFGIARARDRLTKTRVGVAKGKLAYMSPEQLAAAPMDGRADLFSLGCVLHLMCVGRTPLEPRNGTREPGKYSIEIDPRVPRDLQVIIRRATQWSKDLRYANGVEMAEQCEAAFAVRAPQKEAHSVIALWAKRYRALMSAIASVSTAVVSPAAIPKLKDLFDLDLELISDRDDPVRRFSSIVQAPSDPIASSPTEETQIVERRATSSLEEEELREIVRVLTLESDDSDTAPPAGEDSSTPEDEDTSAISKRTDDIIGIVLHGYRVEERIGGGISAAVFRARHQVLAKECAVKVLVERFASQEAAQKRLKREAEMLSRIVHENIIGVLDFGTTPSGAPFLMTELLRGQTLQRIIAKEGPIEPARAVRIARQIAAGLAEAHRHGLVHRDLKPANVMIVDGAKGETIKILDFGMVRVLRTEGELTKLTATGFLLGTPAYAAPEQILKPSSAGLEADIYSLGVIMFEMLTGKRPFVGPVYDVLSAHLNAPPPPLDDLGGVEEIVAAMLEKDSAQRPTADSVLRSLEHAAIISETIHVSPTSTALRVSEHWRSRSRVRFGWVMLVFGGALVGAVIATAAAYVMRSPPREVEYLDPQIVPRIEGEGVHAVARDRSHGGMGADGTSERGESVPLADEQDDPSDADPQGRTGSRERSHRASEGAPDRTPASSVEREPRTSRDRGARNHVNAVRETAPPAEPLTPDFVLGKLRKISSLLTTSSDRLPPTELEAFESRYFSLRSEARPPLDAQRAERLAPRVIALEAELAKRISAEH